MKTYPLYSKDGHSFAFEIDNAYITSRKIKAVLSQIDGVSDIRMRKPFSSPGDIHVEFRYLGTDFVVWEPYGDNSRYWIGPKDKEYASIEIAHIENAFILYNPPFAIKFLGDLVLFRFKDLFKKWISPSRGR
jgi:hypothetical protein